MISAEYMFSSTAYLHAVFIASMTSKRKRSLGHGRRLCGAGTTFRRLGDERENSRPLPLSTCERQEGRHSPAPAVDV